MKKMILVPEAVLDTITRKDQQHSTAELDQVVRLDREIEQLLSRKNLSLHQKAIMYNDIVQQYLHFRGEARNNTSSVVADAQIAAALPSEQRSTAIESEVEQRRRSDHDELESLAQASLPKSYRSKGQRLLAHMRDSGLANWSPTTHEFIYEGEPVRGSNISDLLYHATVPSKRAAPPGTAEFLSALGAANVPRILRRTDLETGAAHPLATKRRPIESPSVPKKRRLKALIHASDEEQGFEDASSKWLT
jgi:hypothetical protein